MTVDINKIGHRAYLRALPDYKKVRDCFDGERAIKEAGQLYLPMLKAQDPIDYENYKYRALFFPITSKTCAAMVGMATSKAPKVDYPTELEPYFVDSGSSFQFTESYVSIFSEVILMGRYGYLIDAPSDSEGPAFFSPYRAENIVNWDHDLITGELNMLLLRECIVVPGPQQFETIEKVRFRHCFVENGVYHVQTYDEDMKPDGVQITPMFSGSSIDFVPFVCFGASGVHMDVDKPPMLDIATINISHYLTSADLEWGRHIVGLPTPVVSGVDTATKLHIGGTAAWILPNAEAKAYYLEFIGEGLSSLEKAMSEKVSLMATISARLVDHSSRGSEAAETVRLRYMSESASLIQMINAIESGLIQLYAMLAKLRKASSNPTIKFSKEILGSGMTFKDLEIIFEGYLKGLVSKESLLYNLRRMDAIDPHRTDDQELGEIKDPPPSTPPTPPGRIAGNNSAD